MRKHFVLHGCVGAAMVLLGACGGRDTETKRNVESALQQANIPNVMVEVLEDGRLHLHGTVSTMSQRSRADEIAVAAVGTSGQVVNELLVDDVQSDVADTADDRMERAIDELLDGDPVFRERDINLRIAEGSVTVTGVVRTPAEKAKVSELVRMVPGVKDLANALEIRAEPE